MHYTSWILVDKTWGFYRLALENTCITSMNTAGYMVHNTLYLHSMKPCFQPEATVRRYILYHQSHM